MSVHHVLRTLSSDGSASPEQGSSLPEYAIDKVNQLKVVAMAKMYKVRVKGTAQLNGPLKIDKTVEMEEQMAHKFNGGERYKVMESFVLTHYPGAKIQSIRGFGAEITPIKESKSGKKSNRRSYKEEIPAKGMSTKKIIGGAIAAAIIVPIVKEVFNEVKDAIQKVRKK